jgi:predicted RNase H-like HicB family nuclease
VKRLGDYTVVIYPEGSGSVAFVPALPGCEASASTPDEARLALYPIFNEIREAYAERDAEMPHDVSLDWDEPFRDLARVQGHDVLGSKSIRDYVIVIEPEGGYFAAHIPAILSCRTIGDTSEEAWVELKGIFQASVEEPGPDTGRRPDGPQALVAVAS